MKQHKRGASSRLVVFAIAVTALLAPSCGLAPDDTAGDAAKLRGPERAERDQTGTPSTTVPVATSQIPAPPLDVPVEPEPMNVPEFPDTLEGRVQKLRYFDLLYTRVFPEPNPSELCKRLDLFREAGYELHLVSSADPDSGSLRDAFLDILGTMTDLLPVVPEEDHAELSAALLEVRPAMDHIRTLDTVQELRAFTDPLIGRYRPLMEQLTSRLLPSCPHLPA